MSATAASTAAESPTAMSVDSSSDALVSMPKSESLKLPIETADGSSSDEINVNEMPASKLSPLASATMTGATSRSVAFQTNNGLTPEALARSFEKIASAALGSNDADEIFNALLDFAVERELNSITVKNIVAVLFTQKKVNAKVVQAWAKDAALALGEVDDPNASDTIVKIELDEYGKSRADWEFSTYADEASRWAKIFIETFFSDPPNRIPLPTISFEPARRSNLGWYRLQRDGLGLRHRINLNARHIGDPLWDRLSTLLHELIHEWEEVVLGKKFGGWYHTKAFRDKAADFGIPSDSRGHSLPIDPQGRFAELLRRHNVPIEAVPAQVKRKPSALLNWRCTPGCTSLWASRAVKVEATCNKCKQAFLQSESR